MDPPSIQPSSSTEPVWGPVVPERSPGAEGLSAGADFVVMDGQGRMLRGLNATGAAVWGLIDGRRPLAEIAAEIARRYPVPLPRALEDVVAFARAMAERRLIRLRGEIR